MKNGIKSSILSLLVFTVLFAQAQAPKWENPEWENPEIFQIIVMKMQKWHWRMKVGKTPLFINH